MCLATLLENCQSSVSDSDILQAFEVYLLNYAAVKLGTGKLPCDFRHTSQQTQLSLFHGSAQIPEVGTVERSSPNVSRYLSSWLLLQSSVCRM